MNPKLLVVDDDEDIRSQLKWALAGSYEVVQAGDRPGALEAFRAHQPLVVLLDLGLPPHPSDPTEGFAILSEILQLNGLTKVIIASGQGERENALKAVGEGAYDFLGKPVDVAELKVILHRAFHVAELEREYQEMQRQLTEESFEGMLGSSPHMQQVFSNIRKVATSEAPVLILGESGTGKEMAAVAIHRRSPRASGPFVPINCGAIPENLLESELFGHEKGSFTGAHAQRAGRFESAANGTLFLDEIGELPLALQVKLLRFLQEGMIERVGGRKPIEVNTRVIAATNSDLSRAMSEGKFREDLYYRLAVVVIKLPPLRQRQSDIPLLAEAFLNRFAGEEKRSGVRFSKQAITTLLDHHWPGNVRELQNRVKRAVIMADGTQVGPVDLELESTSPVGPRQGLKQAREEMERKLVREALDRAQGNISSAAAELHISRPTVYELMDKYGIRRAE